MKILIVDDSVRMREFIISMLNNNKLLFYECSDGAEALSEYNRIMPDVVLMDIQMKDKNGLEAAAEIKQHFPEANIIIITNYDDSLYRLKALQTGIKHYILKEDLSSICEIIKQYEQ